MVIMKVVPAILAKSAQELKNTIDNLIPHFDTFQIDIQDGEFVPEKTVGIEEATSVLINYGNASFDFHLMVFDFGKCINYLRNLTSKIQIKHIFIHHKATPPNTLFESGSGPFSIGLVINPDEEVKQLSTLYSFEKMAAIQVMSVHPGAQGQQFIKESLRKIEQLRLLNYRNSVFLDGGVNSETIPFILAQHSPPDVLCIGSYLTKAENLQERITHLKEILAV